MISTMSRKRTVILMAGVMLGMLLAALDQTVVATALPRIVANLGGFALYSWIFTAYMLASTSSIPIFGKLSDIYGRRPFYLGALLLFMFASALCGMSQTMSQLILFRALQGGAAGVIMANAFIIIGDIFPPSERGKWQGLMAAVFGLASIIGPTAGGYITDNLSWRWVFYVNLPVGFLAVLVLFVALPKIRVEGLQRSIDYWGAFTLIIATVPMLLAFVWAGRDYAWLSPQIIGLLLFSAVAYLIFGLIESKAAEPVVPLSLFKNPIFTISIVTIFLTSMGMFGSIILVPLFVQGVIGTSATNSGLVLTPMMLSAVIASAISGQLISRWGRYRLVALAGLALMTFGMYLLFQMGVDATNQLVVRNMIVSGFGLGLVMPIFVVVIQNALPYRLLGVVTSSTQFFRSIGGTIGVAIVGSLMINRLEAEIQTHLPPQILQRVPVSQLKQINNPQALVSPEGMAQLGEQFAQLGPQGSALLEQFVSAMRASLALAIHQAFLVAVVVVALAFLVSLFLKEIPLRKTNVPETMETGEEVFDELIPRKQDRRSESGV